VNSFLATTTVLVLSFLALSEFADWAPYFARRIVRRAVRRIPEEYRDRYQEEWTAELDAVEGKLSKLLLACGVALNAPSISRELRSSPRQPIRKTSRRRKRKERPRGRRLEGLAQTASIALTSGLVVAMVSSAQITAGRIAIAGATVVFVAAVMAIGYFFVRRSEREFQRLPLIRESRTQGQSDEREESMRALKERMEAAFAALAQARVPQERERAAEEAADVVVESLLDATSNPADHSRGTPPQPQRSRSDGTGLQPG
jgi:hypothetical protein